MISKHIEFLNMLKRNVTFLFLFFSCSALIYKFIKFSFAIKIENRKDYDLYILSIIGAPLVECPCVF